MEYEVAITSAASSATTIEDAVGALEGVASVDVDSETGTATVEYDPETVSAATIDDVIDTAVAEPTGVDTNDRTASSRAVISPRLRTASAIGTAGFAVSVVLWVLSFFTNQSPAPYYPWLELPTTLPVTQPRIGHYPASWTVGVWLWEFTFPFVLIHTYDRLGGGQRRLERWLVGAPAVYMLAFFSYCRWIWPKPSNPVLIEPAVTGLCWAYCVTYSDFWAVATAAVGLLGLVAWAGSRYRFAESGWLPLAFGVLSLPLGIPAIYAGYVQRRNET